MLAGCSSKNTELERGLQFRTVLLASSSCSFDMTVTADYGDKLHSFAMQCTADAKGTVNLTVTKPQSIAGITAVVDGDDGKLIFDDKALSFPLLADNQVTPISAPWLMVKSLRSGYIAAAGMEGDLLRLSIDDSYDDDALRLEIWLDGSNCPLRSEVIYRERKILSMDVENFRM